jgi:urease subunit gamma/beta
MRRPPFCGVRATGLVASRAMRLLPREQERLLLFLAAELARSRRARGLVLNQAEATAIVADTVCEAARDGASYAEAEAAGYAALTESDVAPGVAALVGHVEVEALFADGSRLIVLHDPIRSDGPPQPREVEPKWLDPQDPAGPRAGGISLEVANEGEVLVGVTSHFHFFEVNRALNFDRAAAWGMRLAVPAGTKVFFAPGEPRTIHLTPFRGARVIRGHAGLADGPLDAAGALERALALARERGYRGA